MLGILGGYPNNYISSFDFWYTFLKFEKVSENWIEQSKNLANFMDEMYKNKKIISKKDVSIAYNYEEIMHNLEELLENS